MRLAIHAKNDVRELYGLTTLKLVDDIFQDIVKVSGWLVADLVVNLGEVWNSTLHVFETCWIGFAEWNDFDFAL